MIRVHITQAAFAAIAASVPGAASFEEQRESGALRFGPSPAGCAPIFLPKEVIASLNAQRGKGESLSDVILRVARG